MNKTAIKNFSVWARKRLIGDITYKAGLLGITVDGIKEALPQSTKDIEFYDIGTKEPYQISGNALKQRKQLVEVIRQKSKDLPFSEAYRNVIEEVAYTWFNRLIAIRFMEVNDYLPAHIRVLSSDSEGKMEPDIVTRPFDAELDFTEEEEQYILKLKNDNAVNELFQVLFIRQCNVLNDLLPRLFEKTADYTELLLHLSVTDQDGVVYRLTHDIEEKDFNIAEGGQVEIIGWMYQYYNIQPKDEAFALLKKNVKITKERIPAATQLFTPDWIVRYMVENSLGRLWLEGHTNNNLKKEWKYYLDEAEQEADVAAQLEEIRKEYQHIIPEDIKIIDPCMGSGHILVYAFEVLMQIYESAGYSQRDAAKSIVENNIYGLDIDDRAFQLAYFAVMMKARQYNRRILTQEIEPNLCSIQESNGLQYEADIAEQLLRAEHRETLQYLLNTFVDAKEYGSILEIENRDYLGFLASWKLAQEQAAENIVTILWYSELNKIVPTLAKQAMLLAQKYDVVVTNPPYMSGSGMNPKLLDMVKNIYKEYKTDLYSCFIKKGFQLLKNNRYMGLMTSYTWMFLTVFSKMRKMLLSKYYILSLIQPEYHSFFQEAFVPICTFIVNNSDINYNGTYVKLSEFTGVDEQRKRTLDAINNPQCGYRFSIQRNLLLKIPESPIAYWLRPETIELFSNESLLSNFVDLKQGLITGDNNRFLRFWQECDSNKITTEHKSLKKWFFYHKGGEYRKWYGNINLVVNWEDNGNEIINFRDEKGRQRSRPQNVKYYLQEGFTWTALTIANLNVRYMPSGAIFDAKGSSGFVKNCEEIFYVIGLCNSKVAMEFLSFLAPTMDYNVGAIGKIPYLYDNKIKERIDELVKKCIKIEKLDWDSFEVSWEFMIHPLLCGEQTIEKAFDNWSVICEDRIKELKDNEEQINKIFIDLYGFTNELNPQVELKDINIHRPNIKNDIQSLISYAVGCIFGRYSLDQEGLLYAGGEWDNLKYSNFISNKDNIIPITDEEYFENDIVFLFVEWLKRAYGNEMIEENLNFIASGLENRGKTSREVLRNYFIYDFYKYHCTIYSNATSGKRPIYWLFDSGKQNGFKALIYMHRYNADTIGTIRVDYLHRMERIYESEINRMQDTIDHSNAAREITTATKRKEKLQKQLKECREFDEKIGHLALSRIEIDLDDGVKVNYEKIQTADDGKKYQVLAKI